MKEVGKRLKDFRKSEGLTCERFAEKLKVSKSYQSKIELGYRNASKKYIERFHLTFPNADIVGIFFN